MNKIHVLDLHFLAHQDAIAAFLVETSEGLVLVETGPHSTLPSLEKAVVEKGFQLTDIQHVMLTHIHLDHAGAAWALARHGARVYVHPFGAKHLENPEKLMHSAKRIYQDQMDRLWGEMHPIPAAQLHQTQHEEKIRIGDAVFTAWHTPGHAVHHIAWQLGEVIFTGDVAGVKINDGMVVPPCPPPDINLEDWEKSIALLGKLKPKTLFLTHFGKIEEGEIEKHLSELQDILWDWANWIKPHWEAGANPAELTPKFQAYVQKQLLDFGVKQEDLARYEAANPSWMSVAGLMRYWKKKEA